MSPHWKAFVATNPTDCSLPAFCTWLSAQWDLWRALRGIDPNAPLSPSQRADFDDYLAQRRVAAGYAAFHATLHRPYVMPRVAR